MKTMETSVTIQSLSKEERYQEIIPQIKSLLEGETDLIANLANTVAALKLALGTETSWVGFYVAKLDELVLGPFQGKPACVRISFGKGVCGTAAREGRTVIVPDVDKFPGHIFCDPDSKSEIVVPIIRDGEVLGMLDVDSSQFDAFDSVDRQYLEQVASLLTKKFP